LLVEKLKTVDAFVVFDLDDAPTSLGVVRSAPKILVDGATWLARSQTYQLASFELKAGGASAGVNAPPDARDAAVAAFAAEIEPWVAAGRLVPDAAKGVRPDDLAPLRSVDPRPADYWDRCPSLAATGIVASLEVALDGLEGRTIAIEGFDDASAVVVTGVAERGARVVAVGTAAGTAVDPAGFPADAVAGAWGAHGVDLVRELAADPEPVGAVLGATADALVCGSRAGVVDHGVAAGCSVGVVVPSGPIPVTAKGLAVLRRAGVVVLPDFITTAGPLLGGAAPVLDGAAPPDVAPAIAAALRDVIGHEQGPVLGACHRAEAFLRTWRSELPFGRPLA
jgi:glutamate dehydrogenase/leucine dehydrogenase